MKPSGIGGQAVIEGIMMRNKDHYSIAVRKPDNEIEVVVKESKLLTEKHKWLNIPILRGIVSFIDSLVVGTATISYSASFYDDPAEQERTRADEIGKSILKDKFESVLMAVTVIFSIFLAVGLFMILPYLATKIISKYVVSRTVLNVIEGFVRLLIFVIYILLISLMKDIKRTFMYHGAEHKCINCIENGARLTPENVKNSSRYHKRCGTSFLFFVMIVSIIFFIFIRVDNTVLQIVIRLLLIPVIAGVSYEFIRLAGKYDNAFVRAISKPGMFIQKLTTREPDMDMIEVAIKAVEEVFDWTAFLEEYYSESNHPVADLVAYETELKIIGALNGMEQPRTIAAGEEEQEVDLSSMTAEERYIQVGKDFGMDEYERQDFDDVYEISDESESTVFDNDDTEAIAQEFDYSMGADVDSKIEEYDEGDLTESDDFEMEDTYEYETIPEEVPMFKSREHKKKY